MSQHVLGEQGCIKFWKLALAQEGLFQNVTHYHFTTTRGTKVGNLNNKGYRTANINLKQQQKKNHNKKKERDV